MKSPSKETTETISVSLPSELIAMVDIACRELDFSRSKFISHAVRDKVVTTFFKISSDIRDGFYNTITERFQSGSNE